MSLSAAIFGLSGPKLTAGEAAFFRDCNPWGFILFARNIETPEQVKKLTHDIRDSIGRDCLIFIDQEGGRVQRLRPPHWQRFPSGAQYADLYAINKRRAKRAVFLNHRVIADDLRTLGINADCTPVLDLPQPNADPIISDRALGTVPNTIIELAHPIMAGLMSGGVAPVIKHMPGHGRAEVDSHKALPTITADIYTLDNSDFIPFRAFAEAPMAMTAHAVYTTSSNAAVTVSRKAFVELIRAKIGYDGLVMSDDLDMKALSGTLTRKTERALAAGCDIALQCSGKLSDMVKVAKGLKPLEERSLERAKVAELCTEDRFDFDRKSALAEIADLMPDHGFFA